MTTGSPDYTKMVRLLGVDEDGNLRTIRLDGTGRIEALMKGLFEDTLKTMSLDDEGRMQSVLYGMYEGSPKAVLVDASGRLSITEMAQTDIGHDADEAQSWSTPLTSLLSNLNRVRWSIVQITGEAWGTVSHSIATVWAKFHATSGHKHTGAANDAPRMATGAISSGRFPLARIPEGTDGHFLRGTGVGSSPAYEAVAVARVSNGTYVGNNGAARQIVHSLGATPKIVLITGSTSAFKFRLHGGCSYIFYEQGSVTGIHGVPQPTSTVFTVGHGSSYPQSANVAGTTYYWTAIG